MSKPGNDLPVLVIRPEPGNAATCRAARERGLDARSFPLFSVEPLAWAAPAARFDRILAGSANVFRHGGASLATLTHVPVIAVGEATAQAAREAGFAVARTGEGGLQPVVATLPPGDYLRIAGADHIVLDPPAGVRIATVIAYAAQRRPLPDAAIAVLARGAVVLLHSGEAARHFADECERSCISRQNVQLACLAPRIAEMAGAGWKAVAVARARTDAELLELAARMCQTV
ncbi:MAG: uroporphyrinogen-III synthase [Novosphingobium meiothermophilum]|uniref:uroporphyrinogen-III synthase n=1 Tax=Novosphingobium TaxID=165696 RepID=UPI000D6E468E|nr:MULTISPECIES: uroporphyrinogen-III synthase [Novosphingobium]